MEEGIPVWELVGFEICNLGNVINRLEEDVTLLIGHRKIVLYVTLFD